MASRGVFVGAGVLGILLGAAGAPAKDIGVAPRKFLVLDRPLSATTEVLFAAKDGAIANGRAADVEDVRARLHVQYEDGTTAVAFMVPPGTANGWSRNDPRMTRFHNRDATREVTEVQSIVVRPQRALKVTGTGRGHSSLDVARAGAPTSKIYVSLEMVEAGTTTRLCSEVQNCEYRALDGGTGAKLRCSGGVADPLCRAAHPVYVSGADARYGGAGTLAVIGDSITVQATAALQDALATRWYTHVRAAGGRMFRDLQPAAERIGESQPQVVVIHLGTNDYACALRNEYLPDTPCRYPDLTFENEIDDARAMVGSLPGACIVGTTTWFGSVDFWWDMLASGEIAGVVPWKEYLTSLSPEERQLLLHPDNLGHLTVAGTVALAQLTAEVVAQACGGSF